MKLDPTTLVVYSLAVFRTTRLVVADTITAPIREALRTRSNRPDALGRRKAYRRTFRFLFELATCPWCLSIWFAVPAVVAIELGWSWTFWLALGLAFSAVTGFLSEFAF